MMTSPFGTPQSIGKVTTVQSIGAGIAMHIGKSKRVALILDLFGDADSTQRLHQLPYAVSPYLAGKIAASLALRCSRLGPEAMADFSQAMADATVNYHARHDCDGA